MCVLLAGRAFGQSDVANGKALFQTCAGCHNVNAPSLRSLFGKVTLRNGKPVNDRNVRAIVLDGLNGMPPFRYSFRLAEMDDLMAYLHTLTAKPAQTVSTEGSQYFKAYCVRCHNPDSRTAPGPDLRGRYRDEWVKLVNEGHAGAPPLKDWLDAPSRDALTVWLRTY